MQSNFQNWTIFLDRDGVVNQKIEGDYVRKVYQFKPIKGAIKAIAELSRIFKYTIIVTNQRGIGKGVMTPSQLLKIHSLMVSKVVKHLGRIDAIYYCPEISEDSKCRKPNIGMALKAKLEHPDIDFLKSIMVGDSISDMEFGKRLQMKTVFIGSFDNKYSHLIDISEDSLIKFYEGVSTGKYLSLLK